MHDGTGPSVELELKLQVPPAQWHHIVGEFGRLPGGVRRIHLEAHYLDTPTFRLSAAGFAWRLRREDDQWVQTLKSRAAGTGFGRLEHNVHLTHEATTPPSPDASLHAGTAAGERLRAVLGSLDEPIGVQYRTDIERLVALQTASSGGTVELALDHGVIVAGDRSTDVRELEIELVTGTADDVVEVALDWANTTGLWSDSMHKARRGMLLARGVTMLPVQRSGDTSISSLVDAIRSNLSAVTNHLGGADHLMAIADDLHRVAGALDEREAQPLEAIADAIGSLGRDATDGERIALLTDFTVNTAVIALLRHIV